MNWKERFFKGAGLAQMGVHLLALWKLVKHPHTPRAPRLIAFAVIAYAVSPIDLIPDFIPVLGLLDELILIPIGVALVVRLTPRALWEARLQEARASRDALPRLWWGALAVLLAWAALLVALAWWLMPAAAG